MHLSEFIIVEVEHLRVQLLLLKQLLMQNLEPLIMFGSMLLLIHLLQLLLVIHIVTLLKAVSQAFRMFTG